jgi:hypothetical protein
MDMIFCVTGKINILSTEIGWYFVAILIQISAWLGTDITMPIVLEPLEAESGAWLN